MSKKYVKRLVVSVLLSILLITVFNFAAVSSWSNGGFSSDPENPDYGTHDWIAQHALDWLPTEEKWFILKNLADYLYGTELPDNGGAPDGIGDTVNHHVYYFANGSLQDDASAVRAQEEYDAAVARFKSGDLVNATKTLGIVTHYVCDVAVFGHVMGSATDWGNETHHSDYEDYVNTRTNNYTDEFNTFLSFDGALTEMSAYDATLMLADDTTFDLHEDLTCVWMDENYDWSNSAFKNRCGESLNLAVNLITDVLHTFYSEMESSAHFINVPFYYQEIDYYCGPACLEMVFDYYGENITQFEIADVARTFPYSTYTDELRRAAHFSNISTSRGDEMLENVTGYTLRKLGYAAFEAHYMDLTQLKSYVDQDKPLILLMWYSDYHYSGHYRVVTGYNETHVFLHDPWNNVTWGGRYGGPDVAFNYTAFLDLWSYYDNWALYTAPWNTDVSATTYMKPETPFQINFTVTYPEPLPNALSDYSASMCNATITLPENMSLLEGEVQKKTLGSGVLEAGANATVSWMLTAESAGTYVITLEVEGLISGSVWPHYVYPAYDYSDRIGTAINFVIEFEEDSSAPVIGIPSRVPEGVVQPLQDVEVSVNATDTESGVKNVTLFYTINDGTTWENRTMNYNQSTSLYEATIPGQPAETTVKFKITACDNVENNATRDEPEINFAYEVIPEFKSYLILLMLITLTMFTVLCAKKPRYKQMLSPAKTQSK